MRSRTASIIWGLLFIAFGISVACNVLFGWQINLFFDGWWTLFIIIPAAMSITRKGWSIGNSIALLIGGYLLISSQDFITVHFLDKLLVPIIFVIIGTGILAKGNFHSEKRIDMNVSSGVNEHVGIFSSNKVRYPMEKFDQCSATAVFGEVDLDLRDAVIDEDCVMQIDAIFGGVEVRVPENVRVKISCVPIFGAVKNKTIEPIDLEAPTIFINATCMFGGVDIK